MPVANRDVPDPTHFLALVVTRRLADGGAVVANQRLFRPRSIDDLHVPMRERKWMDLLDAACRECQLPNRLHDPATMIATDTYPGHEFASMIYSIELNGPVAELFNAVHEIDKDVPASVSRLVGAIETFDNALIVAFVALSAKVRCLNIPEMIPLGQSELDMWEARTKPYTGTTV